MCKSTVHLCNSIKNGIYERGLFAWIMLENYFKNFGKLSARYPCYSFFNKLAGMQSSGCNFPENVVLEKSKKEPVFNSKGDLYCIMIHLKANVDANDPKIGLFLHCCRSDH